MSLLALEHVSKRAHDGWRQIVVLDDVSLELDAGETLGVWGMRRSGKSTLLRIAAGRDLPDEGSVNFDGSEITRVSADERAKLRRHAGIGLLSPDWRPARNNPVVEHVAFPLLSDGMSLREAMGPAWAALERVGCTKCAHTLAGGLSNGERIRVALAQTLVREPRVLLIDDPVMLMRPSEGVEFYEMLDSIQRTMGLAVVIAAEDVAPIRKASRMYSIDGSRLRAMDQPGRVLTFPERKRSQS
jgi:putative ABC transport system ATP-binding protein